MKLHIVAVALLGLVVVGCNKKATTAVAPSSDSSLMAVQTMPEPAPVMTPVVSPVSVTPVAVDVTTPAPVASGKVYVVKPKDTLFSIAKAHYGNGAKYKDILAANPGLTTNIKVGQKITLP